MKYFFVRTISYSFDHYSYLIKHPQKPTEEEMKRFLSKHAHDKNKKECFEHVESIEEYILESFLEIPKKGKILDFIS